MLACLLAAAVGVDGWEGEGSLKLDGLIPCVGSWMENRRLCCCGCVDQLIICTVLFWAVLNVFRPSIVSTTVYYISKSYIERALSVVDVPPWAVCKSCLGQSL